ncbi:transcriptional regulator [Microvirga tunisiensis]|uniref:Transcriptional regulator n=1 Tax=Pannonibacter tanglangensis TaxID=2750084 RepID=A0A7X5F1E9_9HYPH|nr:winged helix-turn-helix transcriptional regulator [Pannonibacter sp. XCT-53]NBN78005.1 transcriptional regulator [Pannonibacter sp. XCT-53]
MDINLLVKITSRAWALSILDKLHLGIPGRQAALLAATGAGRTAFLQSLEHLVTLGLLERNPGHGHPLRPEFRLTPAGVAAAGLAHEVLKAVRQDEQDLLRLSWTLPVLATLQAAHPFGEIRRSLPSITDRALSHSLRSMEQRTWIHRHVEETTRPPRPLYMAINNGAVVSSLAGAVLGR